MTSIHFLVAEASRRRHHISAVELRLEELRTVNPSGDLHASHRARNIEAGEDVLAAHRDGLRRCLDELGEELTRRYADLAEEDAPVPRFELPVSAAGDHFRGRQAQMSMSDPTGILDELQKHAGRIVSIEERLDGLRAVEPRDPRHAESLDDLISFGERLLAIHGKDLHRCLDKLAGETSLPGKLDLGNDPGPAAFQLPVVATGASSLRASTPDAHLLQK